jgi:alpha-D-ribose 1-methylphosphonate 5-triphosphate diphosphatase PhnM
VETSVCIHTDFLLPDQWDFTVSQAINTISLNRAQCLKLKDRGEIAIGKRTDFSR